MIKKSFNRKNYQFNLGSLACLIATGFAIYYLLVKDQLLPSSISFISALTSHMTQHWHILVVGLVPVYLALIIFGAAILSIFLGSYLQTSLIQLWKNRHK